MTAKRPLILGLILLLGACQGKGPASPRLGVPAIRAAGPSASAAAASPVAVRPPTRLRAPDGSTRLAGTLRLDAAAVLAAGGRRVGDAVAPPGADRDEAFGLISNNGGALVSDHGVGLIANNGGAIVSNNGGNVVSNNGGQLIGKVKYRAMQAADASKAPAAGMWVGLVGMLDGVPLPVGVDDAGAPVYTVSTDARGGFELFVADDVRQNVGIVAIAPGATDGGLAFGYVTSPRPAAPVALDEDAALASDLLREILIMRLDGRFLEDPKALEPDPASDDAVRQAYKAQLRPLLTRVRTAVLEAGITRLGPAAQQRIYRRFADAACAWVDLPAIEIATPGGGTTSALASAAGHFGAIRAGAARVLAADPTAFDGAPYILRLNARRAGRGAPPITVRGPEDVAGPILRDYLGPDEDFVVSEAPFLLADLGLPADAIGELKTAGAAMFLALGTALADEAAVGPALERTLRAAIAAELAAPPAAEPSAAAGGAAQAIPVVVEPPVEVVTLAGTGARGIQDGVAAGARFDVPIGLVLDESNPAAPALYVGDYENAAIRLISLALPGLPVTTIFGHPLGDAATGQVGIGGIAGLAHRVGERPTLAFADMAVHRIVEVQAVGPSKLVSRVLAGPEPASLTGGFRDGAAATATFEAPHTVAFDATGALVVGDQGNHRVRRIAPAAAGGETVSTLAGGGTTPWRPGARADARLERPEAVAVDKGGEVLVADKVAGRIYRLREGRLDLVAGSGKNGRRDGFWIDAELGGPTAMAWAPDGSLVFTDGFTGGVRRLTFTPGGAAVVTTIAGGTVGGFADGPGPEARFDQPAGVAVGADGTIYVADSANHRIRAIRRR